MNRLLTTAPSCPKSSNDVGFGADDTDSILVLAFSETPSGGHIDLVHTGVADRDYEGVTEGWKKFYWDAGRAFLQARETPT